MALLNYSLHLTDSYDKIKNIETILPPNNKIIFDNGEGTETVTYFFRDPLDLGQIRDITVCLVEQRVCDFGFKTPKKQRRYN